VGPSLRLGDGMPTFVEGEKVLYVGDHSNGEDRKAVGTVEQIGDADNDPVYLVYWEDGEYSTHTESELVALSEG
jgi:hypothetical protein